MRQNLLINFLACVKFIVKRPQGITKFTNKSGGNNSIKPFQLYLRVYGLAFGLFLYSAIQIILEICLLAIIVLYGVVTTIEGTHRFYSPRNNNDVLSWARTICDQFKVSLLCWTKSYWSLTKFA